MCSPQIGFEPMTNRLTVERSTTELLRNIILKFFNFIIAKNFESFQQHAGPFTWSSAHRWWGIILRTIPMVAKGQLFYFFLFFFNQWKKPYRPTHTKTIGRVHKANFCPAKLWRLRLKGIETDSEARGRFFNASEIGAPGRPCFKNVNAELTDR